MTCLRRRFGLVALWLLGRLGLLAGRGGSATPLRRAAVQRLALGRELLGEQVQLDLQRVGVGAAELVEFGAQLGEATVQKAVLALDDHRLGAEDGQVGFAGQFHLAILAELDAKTTVYGENSGGERATFPTKVHPCRNSASSGAVSAIGSPG